MTGDPQAEGRQAATNDLFWTALSDGHLHLQRCLQCGSFRYFPGPVCPGCLHPGGEWTRVSGRGRLYAFTVVHRAPSPAFVREVPYVIALVDLEEGPRVMARLEGCTPEALRAGTPVALAGAGDSGAGPWMRFRPIDPGGGGDRL